MTTVLASPSAWAAPLGTQGTLAVGAERVSGINFGSFTGDVADNGDVDWNHVAVFGSPYGFSPYSTPRAGVDYFIADRLSFGGNFTFASYNMDGGGDLDVIALTPRVGYALELSPTIALWFRGGFTYYNWDGLYGDASGLGLGVEGVFAFSPADHVAITAAPSLDVGVLGHIATRGDDPSARLNNFGLNAGLLVWFN